MKTFIIGMLFGASVLTISLVFTPSVCKLGHDALEECQKDLPRNQTCEIYAKPMVKIDEK